jgi:DNA polymerase III subunit epsilon
VPPTGSFFCIRCIFVPWVYAIIDIETSGGNPARDKITEIAVILHDGKEVVREFTTLVNPECRIPYHITALTGITNEMVANAPRFYEIARDLVEITRDAVFVAHNVSFDYNFVRNEFKQLGYEFKRDQLCTVRLSRKLLPGHRSYSLGRLCEDLNIEVRGRHRAYGDAMATATLFGLLLGKEREADARYITGAHTLPKDLHPALDLQLLRKLPEAPGVYYFYNKDLELIYIGKSKNIRNRVMSHFSNQTTGKAIRMRADIADISYEVTGSELIALLKESEEIKKFRPLYNRTQRRSLFRYGLFSNRNEAGYIVFSLGKTSETDAQPLVCFTGKAEATEFMNRIIDRFGLCQKLAGMYPSPGPCFHHEIGACKGACVGKELPSSYNLRAEKVLNTYRFGFDNLLIVDAGRSVEEKGVVKIENGRYIGYGFFSPEFADTDNRILHDCVMTYTDNREVQQIIRQYLRNNQVDKIIAF